MADEPISNAQYTLIVEGQNYNGTTNPDGLLEAKVHPGAASGELLLEKLEYRIRLHFGHLDPIEEDDRPIISGIQARMNNLGFLSAKVDGVLGGKTVSSIKYFQQLILKRENPDGEPDAETRDELLKQHGC